MQSETSISFFMELDSPENMLFVLLINEDTSERNIIALWPSVCCERDSFGVDRLLQNLKEKGNPLDYCMIFWFNPDNDRFIYLGNDPIPEDLYIYFSQARGLKVILKYRKPHNSNILCDALNDQTIKDASIDFIMKEKAGRRAKERKISNVIEKVGIWRKLFSGINIEGNSIQIGLEAAANQVGLSKKTLDDYLTQLSLKFDTGMVDWDAKGKEKEMAFSLLKHRIPTLSLLKLVFN